MRQKFPRTKQKWHLYNCEWFLSCSLFTRQVIWQQVHLHNCANAWALSGTNLVLNVLFLNRDQLFMPTTMPSFPKRTGRASEWFVTVSKLKIPWKWVGLAWVSSLYFIWQVNNQPVDFQAFSRSMPNEAFVISSVWSIRNWDVFEKQVV